MILILIPTRLEAKHLLTHPLEEPPARSSDALVARQVPFGNTRVDVGICGMGLVASGIGAMRVLAGKRRDYRHVLLLGVAGGYRRHNIHVGSAVVGSNVCGVDLGIPTSDGNWTTRLDGEVAGLNSPGDSLALATPLKDDAQHGQILSVSTASRDTEMAESRSRRFPGGVVEEMEGYAVAVACAQLNIPLTIIRGISNIAGDRDHGHWRIQEAMQSVNHLAQIAVQRISNGEQL